MNPTSPTPAAASPSSSNISSINSALTIECGPGWVHLVNLVRAEATLRGIRLTQIKQKFGTLRVYYAFDVPNKALADEYQQLLDALDLVSAYTCERCGVPSRLTTSKTGWINTLCEDCRPPEFRNA
jgi:hypothetical protein